MKDEGQSSDSVLHEVKVYGAGRVEIARRPKDETIEETTGRDDEHRSRRFWDEIGDKGYEF